MKSLIFKTQNDWAGFIARLTVGLIIFPHGAQKVLGIWGGHGFSGTMGFFTETLHIPWLFALGVIIIEFVGAISLIIGLAGRIWSALMIALMIGIIFTAHANSGFFMNWTGQNTGEGIEYHLLVIGTSLITLINGSGKYSIDDKIS